MPDAAPRRTAREVIDAAIRENRPWEWLSLSAAALAVAGVTGVVVGVVRGDGVIGLSGAAVGVLM